MIVTTLKRDGRRLSVLLETDGRTQRVTLTGRSVSAIKDTEARVTRWVGRGRPRDGRPFDDVGELARVATEEREAALRFADSKARRSLRRWRS